eukprot:scaffold10623_cov64-Phaeocystis_antarctica.AAC.2
MKDTSAFGLSSSALPHTLLHRNDSRSSSRASIARPSSKRVRSWPKASSSISSETNFRNLGPASS